MISFKAAALASSFCCSSWSRTIGKHLADTLAPDDGGQAQADVGDRPEALDVGRDGQHALLVVQDRLDDPRDRQRHRVEGRPLALDDLLPSRHDRLVDPLPRLVVQGHAARRRVEVHRDLPEAGHAPHRHRRIAVLADHIGVDVARVDVELLAQQVAEARRIERGPRADDLARRSGQALDRQVRQHIHRIGDDDDDGAPVVGDDAGEDLLHDGRVAARQVEARLARLPSSPGRQHDDVGIRDAFVPFGADLDVVQVGRAVGQVERLTQRLLAVDVDQADPRGHIAQEERIGQRRPDVAGADDGDLHVPSVTARYVYPSRASS